MSLILSGYGISIELDRFSGNNFPRERPEPLAFSESRNGATLLSGQAFESKHIWQVSAVLTQSQSLLLGDLYDLFQQSPQALTIADKISPFTEISPRTRPLAPGTTATTIAARVRYFAEFNCGFNSRLSLVKQGLYTAADFQLKELAKRVIS